MVEKLEEVRSTFTLDGKPIHPKVLYEFEGWMSDGGPITLSIDLSSATGSDEYFEGWAEGTTYTEEVPDGERGDVFIYNFLGQLDDGTLAYRASLNSGGTGWFTSVGFVVARLAKLDGRWRIILETRGYELTGDRSNMQLQLRGDHVLVGPSLPGTLDVHASDAQFEARPWRP